MDQRSAVSDQASGQRSAQSSRNNTPAERLPTKKTSVPRDGGDLTK